ncbi:class I SAM-dependent methyltransferase [Paenibacillus sp. JX-17]|uniref:Class I SAM-dependent methyltransferase n=1 Tax=Paenibacillus lacisoli TaxID=3064525 RepID=A0ABT9CDZ1_9BACL|nr:class I SAM-dependent methyltransferase [Paenibacillus sp. JX-17]MDO7907441.1 class I SAM-dependent methyltransferase [Paenibacillus sp. JX-17]
MGFLSVLSFAHKLISERVQPGDIVVDATAGTGADTLFLALAAGRRGKVFSFDIQPEALALTRERLARENKGTLAEAVLLHSGHEYMLEVLPAETHGKIAAVMFNLGYLPSAVADSSVITRTPSTLEALEAAMQVLRPKGIITAVVYPGHPGGSEEAAAVERWASSLPSHAGQAVIYRQIQRATAPYVIAVERK